MYKYINFYLCVSFSDRRQQQQISRHWELSMTWWCSQPYHIEQTSPSSSFTSTLEASLMIIWPRSQGINDRHRPRILMPLR